MTEREQTFHLGPARLYIAPASVSEEAARTLAYYAGATKGGIRLTYTARIHEITDYTGEVVSSLRYGERVRVDGRLAGFYPRALALATGSPVTDGVMQIGGNAPAGRRIPLRVCIVCALPEEEGGEFVFSMRATACSGMEFAFASERDGSVAFTLSADSDAAGFKGRLVMGGA